LGANGSQPVALHDIARLFGRDHTTVMHSCRKIETEMQNDTELRLAVQGVEQGLK